MTDPTEQLDRARRVIADLRRKLSEAEVRRPDAIAVVGLACRFPGEASDCNGYWRMIKAGRDAVRPVPAARARNMAPGGLKPAALLDDIETFDAAFFDISPREATQMDPQQRLFLEVAWEALEDAGLTRDRLEGSETGVLVGIHNHSNGYFQLQSDGEADLNEFTGLGSGHDVIAGRLGYFLDLHGPSAAINTACSSSLVAVHLACQSLLARDCRMAVSGGVNLILGPAQSRMVSALGNMLAPDGRCKTFDARANGYGRGEGCGVVVLKRLSDAVADRDRVLAVIRGSAVNQDGRTNGLTAPNGLAQQSAMRRALARSGLDASRVGYVEAHGTGTALGDPIEVEALAAVYGAGTERCALGTAKANVNHLEGAAGVAGLIKAILALRAQEIPPVAGFEHPNPHLSLQGTRFFIPTKVSAWQSELPRVAAVSAFGWSGVNAHVLLEEAPDASSRQDPVRPTVLMISAIDPEALSTRALAMAETIANVPEAAVESFAWTAARRRSHYTFRMAVAGHNGAELAENLRRKARRPFEATDPKPPTLGFLIGNDAAAAAIGCELIAQEASFRQAVEECAATFGLAGDEHFRAALTAPWSDASTIPAHIRLFAIAVGVAALLKHWGLSPAAVDGWGVGGLAARYLRGEISLAAAVQQLVLAGGADSGPTEAEARAVRRNVDHTLRLDTLSLELAGSPVPGDSARMRLMRLLETLVEAGADPDWDHVFSAAARPVSLPSHPFRRRRYWIAGPPVQVQDTPVAAETVPDEWMFETQWRPAPTAVVSSRSMNWLVLGAADGESDQLASIVRATGDRAVVETAPHPDVPTLINTMSSGHWALIDLRALHSGDGPVPTEALRLAQQVAELDWALREAPPGLDIKLWVATRGAQRVVAGDTPDLASAALWGLGRSLGLTGSGRWGGLVDFDPVTPPDFRALVEAIASGADEEFEIAFRGGLRFSHRLERMVATAIDTLRLDPTATYLITGAFGGIGPALAMWLARRGAKSLVLVGRSVGGSVARQHAAEAIRRDLAELGVEARLEACDIGDPAAVADLFELLRQSAPPVRGIFHAAAAATSAVEQIGGSDLSEAFRPKLDGALNLDRHSRSLNLGFFVLFSSAAGTLGERGRGHYAAANSFLDALAAARRAEGLPALSIAWGLWGGRADASADVQFFRRVGFDPMPPDTALNAMARLMSGQTAGRNDIQPLVAALDGNRLQSAFELRGRARFMSALAPQSDIVHSEQSRAFIEQVRRAPVGLRQQLLCDAIALEARKVLELEPEDAFDPNRGFFDLGMDSLMTVALKARLEIMFGEALPSTLTMDHPSATALAGYFATKLFGAAPADAPPGEPEVIRGSDTEQAAEYSVDALSDDEVADALTNELQALVPELLR